jgi:hypothetical protein
MVDKRLQVAVVLTVLGAASCAYGPLAPPPEAELVIALCEDRTISTKPFARSAVSMKDTEGIVHVPADDHLWIGDDHSGAVFELDRRTGYYRSRISAADIIEALPEAGRCDDGDQDSWTQCSYTSEIEVVTYDPTSDTLLFFNTVNMPNLDPPVDKPAVFRLRKRGGRGPFRVVDWRELPVGRKYGPAVVIEGKLYLAIGPELFEYNLEGNRFAETDGRGKPLPLLTAASEGPIVGMAFDGSALWLLTGREKLVRVEWSSKAVSASHDVTPSDLRRRAWASARASSSSSTERSESSTFSAWKAGEDRVVARWRAVPLLRLKQLSRAAAGERA